VLNESRRRTLYAALGFLQLPPRTPELRRLHRWLDTWTGVGLITVGVERQGYRLSLSHIAEDEWRAYFMRDNPPAGSEGLWRRSYAHGRRCSGAAWAALGSDERTLDN